MTKTQTTEFDNEMKALSMGVYKGNEKSIPKDWIKVSEYDKKSGFHGEAFYKNGKVVIAMRGTEIPKTNDLTDDFLVRIVYGILQSAYCPREKNTLLYQRQNL